MLAFYGSRVSPHMTETPEGFLICHDVPIARTGKQDYLSREVGGSGDDMVHVYRNEDEVFSQAAMASFEGKPVTDDHPPIQVTAENSGVYAKGHVQNVHRGSGNESDLLLADLFITDGELIRNIKNGLREVSCGYECDYEEDNKGRVYQCRIRGNHVAVVAAGRAGNRVSIKDSKPKKKGEIKMNEKSKTSIVARLFAHWAQDADPSEVAEAVDAMIEEEPEAEMDEDMGNAYDPTVPEKKAPVNQDADENAELISLLKQVLAKLGGAADADPNADPLEQLQDALEEGTEEPVMPQDEEASVTVPAEELNDAEEIPEEEKLAMQSTDSAGTLAAIKAMKPYLAKLNARDRKTASDSIARAVRKARGMSPMPMMDGYAALLKAQSGNARRRAHDSRMSDDKAYGRNCAKRNPHCK